MEDPTVIIEWEETFGKEVADMLAPGKCPRCKRNTLSSSGLALFSVKRRKLGVWVECGHECGYAEAYWMDGEVRPDSER